MTRCRPEIRTYHLPSDERMRYVLSHTISGGMSDILDAHRYREASQTKIKYKIKNINVCIINVYIPSATVFSSTSEISRIKPLIAVITVLGLENNIVCDCIHIIKSSELS